MKNFEMYEILELNIKKNSPMFLSPLLKQNNVPEKIIPIIELTFTYYAYNCLAVILNEYPNYDKFVNKLFIAKKDSHFNTKELKVFEEKFLKEYDRLQQLKYVALDKREGRDE